MAEELGASFRMEQATRVALSSSHRGFCVSRFYAPPFFGKLNEWIHAGMVMGGHFHAIHAHKTCYPSSRPASRKKLEIELLGDSVYITLLSMLRRCKPVGVASLAKLVVILPGRWQNIKLLEGK